MFSNPFRIEQSEHMGRYVTSLKNFEQGDIVWEELPLISAPTERRGAAIGDTIIFPCVGCFKNITSYQMKCPDCNFPCCSVDCSMRESHKKYECPIFSRRSIRLSYHTFENVAYIRFALLKIQESKKYEKLLTLCSQFDTMDRDFQAKLRCKELSLQRFLTDGCELDVSGKEVSKMLAIFLTNNFHILCRVGEYSEFCGQGIYEWSSLLSHCCSPNLKSSFSKVVTENGNTDWKIQFHARRSIRVNEILSISYGSELLLGTVPRQLQILKSRHFICRCSRCTDPTEESTYFSAMVCPQCPNGLLLLAHPNQATTSHWSCTSCSCQKSATFVQTRIQELSVVPMAFYNLYSHDEKSLHSLAEADSFIENATSLHPNHYLLFPCALHWLAQSTFPPLLIGTSENTQKLFKKIMKRLHRYLPLASKFALPQVNARLHYIWAQVVVAFIFQSTDMILIRKRRDDFSSREIKACGDILENLRSSLMWERVMPNGLGFENAVARLNNLIEVWSDHLERINADYNNMEEATLASFRNLFL